MAAEHIERIGARIAQRREELGITQRELAEKLPGKSDGNQVSKWERGKNRVSDDTLEHIARALEVETSYFLVPEPVETSTPDLMGALRTDRPSNGYDAKVDALVLAVGNIAMAMQVTAKGETLGWLEDAVAALEPHMPAASRVAGDPADEALLDAERRTAERNGSTRPGSQGRTGRPKPPDSKSG